MAETDTKVEVAQDAIWGDSVNESDEVRADQRKFDGRAKFKADNEIEEMLAKHFAEYDVDPMEICRNFQVYARRVFLKRFLAHYELFRMTKDLPGDIVELGVYRGQSLMSWANFVEIRNMGEPRQAGHRLRQLAGFHGL